MVSRKTRRRKAIRKARTVRRRYFSLALLCGLLALTVAFATRVILIYLNIDQYSSDKNDNSNIDEIVLPEEEPEPEILKIDFQPTIDTWVNSISGKKGIIIYDLDSEEVVGDYNADVNFATASLYKLFVVYEGYRRVQNGTWDANSVVSWTRRTISECLDLAIRESNSACAEILWNMIGHDELNEIVRTDFEIPSVMVSNLMATPYEIMQIMKKIYNHQEITNEKLLEIMEDSFLNQPITTYNWRQGLPSGFSERVKVYNKVGWNWNGDYWTIYDDAAILDFVDENRHFIAVIMTSGVAYQQIRNLGAQIEATFYDQYVLKN